MGLVVIVLIITVVFLMAITLRVKSKINPQKNTFANDQLATNFLLALLKTDNPLCETQIGTLIRDCARDKKIRCKDGKDSCFHVNQDLTMILPESLGLMQSKYTLRIIKMPENQDLFTPYKSGDPDQDECGAKQNKGMQGYQPINLYPNGRVDVTLDICV